jgi:hypothetical protein
MMMALAAPMVRECCLPVVQAPPCHESKHTDDVTCASNQQAIAGTKAALNVLRPALNCVLLSAQKTNSPILYICRALTTSGLDPKPPTDLYLQTGALLI